MSKQEVNSRQARNDFADHINRVAYGSERLTITRHGKAVAAIVPVEDLEFLERIEDELDRKAIDEALAEQGNQPFEDWDDVKNELDL